MCQKEALRASALRIHDTMLTVLRISCYQITVCCKTHYFCPHIKCDICLYNPCQSHFGGTVMYLFLGDVLSLSQSLSLSLCLPSLLALIQLLLKQMQSKCHCRNEKELFKNASGTRHRGFINSTQAVLSSRAESSTLRP